MLGAPVAGSQVLQDCHQQSSVETVAISCKTRLLLSALKVLCTACILQFVGCWQPGPQDCHQQGSVEAVAISCKVALLLSALKVLCTACIPQHPSVVSVLPGWPRLLLPCVCEHWHWAVCSAERICKAWPACDAAATCSWEHVHGNRTSVHWQLLSES